MNILKASYSVLAGILSHAMRLKGSREMPIATRRHFRKMDNALVANVHNALGLVVVVVVG